MKKSIWLLNFNAMPPEFESRLRTIKFAQYLMEYGYEVTIFSSSIMHNMNIDLISTNDLYIEKNYGTLKFIHIKTRKYSKNGFSRMYSLFEFHVKLCYLKKRFKKPDIIISGAAVPFGNIFYFCAKRLNAQYIIEVLDLWPEAFVAFGVINKRNPFLRLIYWTEKWLYKKADKVVFSMEGGKDYIIKKGWDLEHNGPIDLKKVFYINNGVDLSDFEKNKVIFRLDDNELSSDHFKVIYIGSIRLANNLKMLIDAAELLLDESNIKILIYGDGDERQKLEDYCKLKKISNVYFKQKWIDPKYVPYVLSRSSLNILNYMPNSVWEYGGSQSKLFQYLASGKPICSNLKMGYCLINKNNLGIAKNFESPQEYANAISSIANLDKQKYMQMCLRAKEVANEFDYKLLTKKLIDIF
ncbi:MAG: glycosyltransferase family 4 protein [Tenuifilaceae bacterium]